MINVFLCRYTLLPTIQDSKKYMALNHFHGDLWGEDPKWSVLSHPLPLSQLPSQVSFYTIILCLL